MVISLDGHDARAMTMVSAAVARYRSRMVMRRTSIARLVAFAAATFALALGCSSGGGGGSGATSSGGSTSQSIECAQKSADGSDSDCAALGTPRKLDCETAAAADSAIAAGCVRESADEADDFDVSCPTTVTGKQPSTTTVPCRQKAGADGDPDCASFSGKPKKLDCDTEPNVDEATSAGCTRQSSTSTDVCCPSSVNGVPE